LNLLRKRNISPDGIFRAWNRVFPTTGYLSFAAFVIAAVSGVILAIPYDVAKPAESIQLMLLSNRPAALARAVHYWSAHLFLVFMALHVIEYISRGEEKRVSRGLWVRLALALPAAVLVMLTGFILKGDAESFLALQIFQGLLASLPLGSDEVTFAILGSDLQLVYVHHVATTTIYLWVIAAEHVRRAWPTLASHVMIMAPVLVLSFLVPVYLHDGSDPVKKGPWYFVGLQEILHWVSHPFWVVFALVLILVFFALYPRLPGRFQGAARSILGLLLLAYILFFIIGWFFRGAGWQFVVPWEGLSGAGL
jgi:hypothetical protein